MTAPDTSFQAQLHLMVHENNDIRSRPAPDGESIFVTVEAGQERSWPGFGANLILSGTPERVFGLLDQLRAAAEEAAAQLPKRDVTP